MAPETPIYTLQDEIGKLLGFIDWKTWEARKEAYRMPGSDPSLEQVVIKSGLISLKGDYGASDQVYDWHPGEYWAEAKFVPTVGINDVNRLGKEEWARILPFLIYLHHL